MKALTLVFILQLLCNEALSQASAPLYQIEDVSKRHNIKIKGKLVTEGQPFHSYRELQFSNCAEEYVLASGNFNKSLLIKGRCIGGTKIVPYISRISADTYMGSLHIATIFLQKFVDDFEASDFIEGLIKKEREPYMEHQNGVINIGIEVEYRDKNNLASIVAVLKKEFPQARVTSRPFRP